MTPPEFSSSSEESLDVGVPSADALAIFSSESVMADVSNLVWCKCRRGIPIVANIGRDSVASTTFMRYTKIKRIPQRHEKLILPFIGNYIDFKSENFQIKLKRCFSFLGIFISAPPIESNNFVFGLCLYNTTQDNSLSFLCTMVW